MATAADTENLRPVLKRILQSHQLTTQDVKEKRSRIAVSDKGEFHCEQCTNMWQSMFSWITFDLRELEIDYRWKMKCRKCYLPCIPTFTITQLEAMFDRVVKFYKGEPLSDGVNIGYRGRKTYSQPHRPDLCEKCRWGLENCWFKRLTY